MGTLGFTPRGGANPECMRMTDDPAPKVDNPADRRFFVLDERQWEVFQRLLERPAEDKPGLRALLRGNAAISE